MIRTYFFLLIIILNINIYGNYQENKSILLNNIENNFFEIIIEDFRKINKEEIEYNINKLKNIKESKEISEQILDYLSNLESDINLNRGQVIVFSDNINNLNVIQIPQIHLKNDCSIYLMLNDLKNCGYLSNETENEIKLLFFSIYNIRIKEKLLHDFYITHEYSHLLKNNNFNNYLDNEIHADLTSLSLLSDYKDILYKRKLEKMINFEESHITYLYIKEFLKNNSFNNNFKENQNKILKFINNKKDINYIFSKEEMKKLNEMNNKFIKSLRLMSRKKEIEEKIIIQNMIHSFSLKNLTLERKIKYYDIFYN